MAQEAYMAGIGTFQSNVDVEHPQNIMSAHRQVLSLALLSRTGEERARQLDLSWI
jgi:hypothetical protein